MAAINSCEVIESKIKTSLTEKKIYLAKKRSPRAVENTHWIHKRSNRKKPRNSTMKKEERPKELCESSISRLSVCVYKKRLLEWI